MQDKKTLFSDIDYHITQDEAPSQYLRQKMREGAFREKPWSIFVRMEKTDQDPDYHPEGNVFEHTMMVVDQAALRRHESINPRAFMWGALLHDIGKPDTTMPRKGRLTAYNHDIRGGEMVKDFFAELTEDKELVKQVTALVRWHMQALFVKKHAKLEEMRKDIDYREIALLTYCDRMGRTGVDIEREKANIDEFVKRVTIQL